MHARRQTQHAARGRAVRGWGGAVIEPGYVVLMARYSAWQNDGVLAAVAALSDAQRRAERGAFFGSIAGTLSHLLWADLLWMARLCGGPAPPGGLADSAATYADWPDHADRRRAADRALFGWAQGCDAADIAGEVTWHSAVAGAPVCRARAVCLTHMFNHQTHHRGQVHALLTALGVPTRASDLIFMPAQFQP